MVSFYESAHYLPIINIPMHLLSLHLPTNLPINLRFANRRSAN